MAKASKPTPKEHVYLPRSRIVTSSHLVSVKYPEMSEVEFGLVIAGHAYSRWMVRCMAAAGVRDMAQVDVLILHHVNHFNSEKRLADICFVLNIEDTHVVSYSLKKLATEKLVQCVKRGKEAFYSITSKGSQVCIRYHEIREACLMSGLHGGNEERRILHDSAALLRELSGRFDLAARAATSTILSMPSQEEDTASI